MAQNQTKEELNNGKIDKNSVIVEAGEKNEVLDFLDYIETSNHPSAIKIRNLRQYLSDEELLTAYYNNIGSGVTKEGLESSLEGFFVSLATHITELPNGIVIDLNTGLPDVDKSFEQALDVGIYSKESVIVDSGKNSIERLKEMDVLNLLFDKDDIMDLVTEFKPSFWDSNDLLDLYNTMLELDETDLNVSEKEKNVVRKSKEKIKNSEFEKPGLYEYCYLKAMQLSPEYENNRQMKIIISERIEKLIKKDPKLGEIQIPILDENGNLDQDKLNEMYEYSESKQKILLVGAFHRFNSKDINEIDKLSKEEKNKRLFAAFAALKYKDSDDLDERGLAEHAEQIIKLISPDLDLNNGEMLADFFKNEMEYKGDVSDFSLEKMIKKSSVLFRNMVENTIISGKEITLDSNEEVDLDSFDFEYAKRKSYDSVMKNYFTDSEINFTEEEVRQYDKLYQNATIDSWLENKKNVMKLRYAALLDVREEYKKNPIDTYVEKDLDTVEREIKEFEEKYGKIDITPEEGEVSLEEYKKNFAIADLTKYLTRDAADWSEGVNYSDLDRSHKKGYIKRILVALNNKEIGEPYIEKIALRRLELMNSEGREFVKKNENGKFEINKELLLQEYQEMFGNTYIYSSFEELMQSIKLREKEYVLEKLEEYTKLPPESFNKLNKKSDRKASMEEIEEIRYLSNQKTINKIAKRFNIKNDKEIIDDSIYESDIHLFEICKLQRELRDPKNVEHTQMYSIKLAEIKEFYKKHPQYKDMKLPILNEDGTLNDEEIMKMDQFSEAYQRIIIFEHLDEFKHSKASSIDELSKKDREHVLMCAFAGLKYEKSDDQDLRNLAKRCLDAIKQSYPELDFNDEKQLADFFKEKIGFFGMVEKISKDDIIKITNQELKEATEDYIEKDENIYVDKDIDFSTLDLDSGKRKIYSSVMKNYFVGSKINFLEKDEKNYNEFYNHVTVDSWIENKDEALKLRYLALNEIKNEYKRNPVGKYTEKKLEDIEIALKEFKTKYGDYSNIDYQKNDKSFQKYKKQFVYAGVAKYLTRDASDWSDGIDYSDLDNEHKKRYIRNILVALDNKGKDSYLNKIALRRLELMNSNENKFVEIQDDGKYKINKELVLDEYKKMSKHHYSSYDELVQSAKLRENEYLLTKLEEYTKLNAKDFIKLDNKKDYKKSMEQIEKARYVSNQKKIQAMFDEWKKKDREEPDVEQTSLDKLLEENVQKGAVKEEDLNVATERTEYTEKSSNQEEASIDREEAQGEQTNTGMVLENIDDSATKKTETKTVIIEGKQYTLSEKVKQAVKRVKDFLKKHLSIKNKQGRLGSGEEKVSSTGEATSSSVTGKVQNNSFIQTVVVDTKAAIQESQNLSQTDLQKESQAKSDDEMEIG